jgi:two-component system, sporulation sensor kinase E
MMSNLTEKQKFIPFSITSVKDLSQDQGGSNFFPDYLFILDVYGNILNYNSFNSVNSLPDLKFIINMNISNLFGEHIAREIISGMIKARQMNSFNDVEYTVPINSTNRIFHARFIPAAEGSTILLVRDVTKMVRAEEALIQSDLRFRSVWENSIDGMRLLDMNGNIVAANQAYSDLIGLDSEDYIGSPFTSIYSSPSPEEKQKALSDFKKNFSSRKIRKHFESDASLISGKELTLEVYSVFIESSQEKALEGEVLLLSIFRDITERKKSENALRNSELRFRSVWENSLDGMRLTDAEGNIVAVNDSFISLTGYSKEELLGCSYTDIYNGKSKEEKEVSLDKYKEKFRDRSFSTVRTSKSSFRTGKVLDLEVTYSIIEYKSGEPLLLAIFHDITERRKAEEEVRRNETLAALGRMAAYLSHEIKTPLASIRMNIDMITRDPDLSKGKQKSLYIIQKEIKRLNRLLRNVLQFSKHHELLIVNINVSVMINGIKELLGVQLSEKKIELINNLDNIKINGDYQKLQSVFFHLLENSIEAIDSNGSIEVYAEENEEEDTTTIFVKDNGCGIGGETRIFEPFYTTKHTGTGLGLAIAQKIIELHNGDLYLHSSSPGETIFAVKFINYGI